MVYYVKYYKSTKGYYSDSMPSKYFSTLTSLKNYFNRTSQVKVKFIKGY